MFIKKYKFYTMCLICLCVYIYYIPAGFMAEDAWECALSLVMTEPSAEIGVADGGEKDLDPNLHLLWRVHLHLFYDKWFSRPPNNSSFTWM